MTTSGRAVGSSACRRKRWKYWAGGRAVRDPDVVLGRELEEALEPGAGVLRPVALVAVRQEERQARRARATSSSPAAMNWSMMICAPLTKSPNWASQSTSASGAATE